MEFAVVVVAIIEHFRLTSMDTNALLNDRACNDTLWKACSLLEAAATNNVNFLNNYKRLSESEQIFLNGRAY